MTNTILKAGALIIEGHVQGLSNTRSLGEIGIPVYVVDKSNCIAQYSKYCLKSFRCPDFILDEFAGFLIDLAIKENLQGWVLLPSNDHAVITISKHKKQLEKYYKIITPEFLIIENIYDKSKLLQIAERNNIPIPVTHYFETIQDVIPSHLTFPVLTKGRNGLSFYKAIGKKVLLAKNEKELIAQFRFISAKYNIKGTISQELIPFIGSNNTISFTAFCINGKIKSYWMGVKLREHPMRFGTATCAKSINVEDCYLQSIPLLEVLNYTGVCEVEYLLDPRDKKYKLIEINARTWLWVSLAKACGVDFAKMIYNYVNHKDNYYPQTFETDIYWFNPFSDIAYAIAGMLQGVVNPLEYFKTIIKPKKVNALFADKDWKPGFFYFFNLLSFYFKR